MSKFTAAAATSHTLSLTAMEEASRRGERTAGIDHLLLALVVNEQVAGQVLRSLGITLESAREAVDAQHAEQLASLGIHSNAPAPGPITFHGTGDYEWGPSALEVVKHSAESKKKGDAAAVLRELIAEPSGLIEAILRRLGATSEVVLDRLGEAERYPVRAQQNPVSGALSGSSVSFVPAEVGRVWELLADPARMPEWEPGTGGVEDLPPHVKVGSSWVARALLERSDGKSLRVPPERRKARVELTAYEATHRIEWCFNWPDVPTSNTRRVRIELEPAAGGTQLLLSAAWVRSPSARRRRIPLLPWLLRPLHRFFMWMQLAQLSGSISRAFR